jgi:hypothetical protein
MEDDRGKVSAPATGINFIVARACSEEMITSVRQAVCVAEFHRDWQITSDTILEEMSQGFIQELEMVTEAINIVVQELLYCVLSMLYDLAGSSRRTQTIVVCDTLTPNEHTLKLKWSREQIRWWNLEIFHFASVVSSSCNNRYISP